MTVIKVLGLGSFVVFDSDLWVREYSADGGEGNGDLDLTGDRRRAFRYPDVATAMAAWQAVSSTHPVRPDGQPNRPLSAFTVEFEPDDVEAVT